MAPDHQFIGEEIGAIVRFEADRDIFDDLDIMAVAVEPLTRGLGKRCHHLFTDDAWRLRRNGETTVHPISANFLALSPDAIQPCAKLVEGHRFRHRPRRCRLDLLHDLRRNIAPAKRAATVVVHARRSVVLLDRPIAQDRRADLTRSASS